MDKRDRRADALPLNYQLHNRYTLGEVLGWGGFGITYVAWDSEQKCPVAVKELYPGSFVTRSDGYRVLPQADAVQTLEKMKDAFSKEALTLIQLQNLSGIVKIYHVFEDNNTIYFSMEFLQGMDFRKYLKENGTMQWSRLSEMMYPVLRGLEDLHREGLIHRDISPDNIFICSDGSARLIDFGLARKFDGNASFTVNLKECFAPWEQYDSHGKQGPWTDVYAMGVTLYIALSGVLPPPAPDRITKVKKTIPLSELCPDLPSYVSESIDKAMAVKIENRYENIGQFCTALYGKKPAQEIPRSIIPQPGAGNLRPGAKDMKPGAGNLRLEANDMKPEAGNLRLGAGNLQPEAGNPKPAGVCLTGAILVCLQGVLAGSVWPIRPDAQIRIGRSNGLEISLWGNQGRPVAGVSRLHCTLMMSRDGTFLLRDEGSTYGTVVNGQKIQPNVWYSLLKGSWIMIGQQIFQIQ